MAQGLAQSSGGRSPRDEDMRHCPEDRITEPPDEGPVMVSGESLTAGSMGAAQATRICALVHKTSQAWGAEPPIWPIFKGWGTPRRPTGPGGGVLALRNGDAVLIRRHNGYPAIDLQASDRAVASDSRARSAAHLADCQGCSEGWRIPHLATTPGEMQKGVAQQRLTHPAHRALLSCHPLQVTQFRTYPPVICRSAKIACK